MALYRADFDVFGTRTRKTVKKSYSHAYAALHSPETAAYIVGFSRTRELAEVQVSKRRHGGWTGPFEIVETKEDEA